MKKLSENTISMIVCALFIITMLFAFSGMYYVVITLSILNVAGSFYIFFRYEKLLWLFTGIMWGINIGIYLGLVSVFN